MELLQERLFGILEDRAMTGEDRIVAALVGAFESSDDPILRGRFVRWVGMQGLGEGTGGSHTSRVPAFPSSGDESMRLLGPDPESSRHSLCDVE